jgi:CTP:molybdopterin cytidylyltransferase MocA
MPVRDEGMGGLPVIVLAAGRGTRMGGPKATMSVGGRPWWMWQSERLAAAGVAAVWVVSPVVRAAMAGGKSGIQPAMVDGSPDAPMFESVRAGLEFVGASRVRGVFVLPVDVPAARMDVWAALAGAGAGAAAPSYRGVHGHPIYLDWGLVERDVATAGPDARLDEIIEGRIVYVDVDDPAVAVNLNTPEDVCAWEQWTAARG